MIRHKITKLRCRGRLGKLNVTQFNITAEHPFVIHHNKDEMHVLGFTEWPMLEDPRGNLVQSYNEDVSVTETSVDGLKQDDIVHKRCTPALIFYDISGKSFQLLTVELNGLDLSLESIDIRHFNREGPNDTMLLIKKNAKLMCNLNTTRLNASIYDRGLINTKVETSAPNGTVVTRRWQLERLKLTMRDAAVVIGIRVNTQIIICIPKTEDVIRCACDILANNACRLEFIGRAQKHENLRVYRQVDPSMMATPPPRETRPPPPPPNTQRQRPTSSSSSYQDDETDSDDEEDVDDYFEQHVAEVVDEKFNPTPHPRFPMKSAVSMTISDTLIRRENEIACVSCTEYRAIFIATPCGCRFSCLKCLPFFQYRTDDCPKCRSRIEAAVFSVEDYNLPREAFQITGPPSQDVFIDKHPNAQPCIRCHTKVAQVMLSCGHKVACLSCGQTAQSAICPTCPEPSCQKPVLFAIVVPP